VSFGGRPDPFAPAFCTVLGLKPWDQQPGWPWVRLPDLWLTKHTFLLACVLSSVKQLLAATW